VNAQYTFEDLVVDADRRELRCRGDVVHTQPQVFDVLCMLLEHHERVVTKEELLDEVWGDRFVTESALASRVKSIRRLLGDDGRRQRLIRTVHGSGSMWVGPSRSGAATRTGGSGRARDDAREGGW
jgi:DNA-binding winged helix-turn-helix (wHTH) protein